MTDETLNKAALSVLFTEVIRRKRPNNDVLVYRNGTFETCMPQCGRLVHRHKNLPPKEVAKNGPDDSVLATITFERTELGFVRKDGRNETVSFFVELD